MASLLSCYTYFDGSFFGYNKNFCRMRSGWIFFIFGSHLELISIRSENRLCISRLFRFFYSRVTIIFTVHSLGKALITFIATFLLLYSLLRASSSITILLNLSSNSFIVSPDFILMLSNFSISTFSLFSLAWSFPSQSWSASP